MSKLARWHPLRELRHAMGRWQREMDQMLDHWGLESSTREGQSRGIGHPDPASHAGGAAPSPYPLPLGGEGRVRGDDRPAKGSGTVSSFATEKETMERTGSSVAEALGRAHVAVLEDLRKLEEASRTAPAGGMAELRARLGATDMHLREHFRFEEQNGYMDMVRKREPRLERTIQQLADEHAQLAQALEALIGEAEAATSLDEPFRDEIQEWVKRVRHHEARENDLVLNAFSLDIDAED